MNRSWRSFALTMIPLVLMAWFQPGRIFDQPSSIFTAMCIVIIFSSSVTPSPWSVWQGALPWSRQRWLRRQLGVESVNIGMVIGLFWALVLARQLLAQPRASVVPWVLAAGLSLALVPWHVSLGLTEKGAAPNPMSPKIIVTALVSGIVGAILLVAARSAPVWWLAFIPPMLALSYLGAWWTARRKLYSRRAS